MPSSDIAQIEGTLQLPGWWMREQTSVAAFQPSFFLLDSREGFVRVWVEEQISLRLSHSSRSISIDHLATSRHE